MIKRKSFHSQIEIKYFILILYYLFVLKGLNKTEKIQVFFLEFSEISSSVFQKKKTFAKWFFSAIVSP